MGTWAARAYAKGGLMSGDVPTQPTQPNRPALNPSALSIGDAARILSAAEGQRVDVAMIQADIDAGAPTNIDGTINLVHYGAWLVKERAGGED
jgi:hypothetical protein